ncbi:Nitroimidazol reductase NimA [Natrarchaeobaculum sulfurireducens]|uniref:Nitroimidazol reductase NimA n=1 Tax=Natrarchaeobaculum sulfurireducens TaxID=2044521 RepID=A0A346PH93_9EURY|nr:Nitroimidazol reductase NimA [Natrarchaeobaculum sulfurireducens]
MRGQLSSADLAAFLEQTAIPIRLACRTPQDNLWMCSLWFRLVTAEAVDDESTGNKAAAGGSTGDEATANGATADNWRLQCATSASADVVSFLESDPNAAFEVSTNQPPYAGVRGRGTVSIEPDPEKETLRDLLERYLGGTDSQLATTLLAPEREEVTLTLEPAVVYGWDYASRMGDVDDDQRS